VRELISSHRTFWKKDDSDDEDSYDSSADSEGKLTFDQWDDFYETQKTYYIPDLSLTIVNLHPESEEGDHIPTLYDYDMTKDRQNDIRFHDKTDYDIKLAQDISDYHDFVKDMTMLANDAIKEIRDLNGVAAANSLKKRFEKILNTKQRTLTRVTNPRYFSDLIYKRFDIEEVIKIQRKDDIHTISDKIFDFSSNTILNLIEEGEKDALKEIVKHELDEIDKKGVKRREKGVEIKNQLTRFMYDLNMKSTTDDQYIIQCAKDELKKIHQILFD
jgi:hypothetical protein